MWRQRIEGFRALLFLGSMPMTFYLREFLGILPCKTNQRTCQKSFLNGTMGTGNSLQEHPEMVGWLVLHP
jgi:hypothetical protein